MLHLKVRKLMINSIRRQLTLLPKNGRPDAVAIALVTPRYHAVNSATTFRVSDGLLAESVTYARLTGYPT